MSACDGNGIGEIVFAFGILRCRCGRGCRARSRRQAPSGRHCTDRSCAPLALASRSSRIAISSLPLQQQPAIARRICRPESEHRDARAIGQRSTQSRQRLRRAPAAYRRICTRISSAPRAIASRAASTACAVPRRSRLHENLAPPAATRCASRRAPRHGRAHHDGDVAVRRLRRRIKHMREQRAARAIACSTFGTRERMRVPSPAASTIARHVRRGIRVGSDFAASYASHSRGARGQKPDTWTHERQQNGICRILLMFSMIRRSRTHGDRAGAGRNQFARATQAWAGLFRPLWLCGWGVGTAVALSALAITSQTETATERLRLIFAISEPTAVAQIPPRVAQLESETQILADRVRALIADRDRLAGRIGLLESSVNDMTGAIRRQAPSTPPPSQHERRPPHPSRAGDRPAVGAASSRRRRARRHSRVPEVKADPVTSVCSLPPERASAARPPPSSRPRQQVRNSALILVARRR